MNQQSHSINNNFSFSMFGMALKFFELNLQPLNILRNSDVSNRQSADPSNEPQSTKVYPKSSQHIKSFNHSDPSLPLQMPDPLSDKENQQKDQLKQSRIKTENSIQMNLEELKLRQQKVLEDFKKSISKSLPSQNLSELDQNQTALHSSNLIDRYDKVGGLVLSKIQELSEEYIEYSMKKEEFVYQESGISSKSEAVQNKNKQSSCELIKSIVKSVLLDENSDKDTPLSHSSLKKSSTQKENALQNFETHQSTERTSQMNQTVTQFIKDLFSSLGLINQSQLQSSSLKELTASAKKNFNQLKGNDYVQKLNQMLQSVENIDKKTHPLGLSCSLKVSHLFHPHGEQKQRKNQEISEDTPSKYRKQILIKKEEDKKVKLISPETFSQLDAKRNNIQSEISAAVQFLTKTRRARKFGFDSFGISQVYINFSMDFKFMSYKQVESNFFGHSNFSKMIKELCSCTKPLFTELQEKDDEKMTIVSLPWNLVNVSKGIKTRNFIKHEEAMSESKKGPEKLHQERCLSLLFKNRTYDFEFQSTQVRDEYFKSIKTMIKSSFEL